MRTYAKLRPKELQHIALDDLDFSWYPHEINSAITQWNAGKSIQSIADSFQRPIEETFLLLLDLAMKGKIPARPSGIFGKEDNHVLR